MEEKNYLYAVMQRCIAAVILNLDLKTIIQSNETHIDHYGSLNRMYGCLRIRNG